jgi:hypothetical protein
MSSPTTRKKRVVNHNRSLIASRWRGSGAHRPRQLYHDEYCFGCPRSSTNPILSFRVTAERQTSPNPPS